MSLDFPVARLRKRKAVKWLPRSLARCRSASASRTCRQKGAGASAISGQTDRFEAVRNPTPRPLHSLAIPGIYTRYVQPEERSVSVPRALLPLPYLLTVTHQPAQRSVYTTSALERDGSSRPTTSERPPRPPCPPERRAEVRSATAERVRVPDGRSLAAQRWAGLHDAAAPRARRARRGRRRRRRAVAEALPDHLSRCAGAGRLAAHATGARPSAAR